MLRIVLLLALVIFQTSCLEQVVEHIGASSQQVNSTLPADHPPVTNPDTITSSKSSILANGTMLMGSRFFIASVLRNIFTSSSFTVSQTATFNSYIDEGIFRYPNIFGGAANLYSTRGLKEMTDATCALSCNNENFQELPLNIASTPGRGVLLTKTCQRILDNGDFLAAGLSKVNVSVVSPYTDAPVFDNNKIAAMYELFLLSTPDTDVQSALAAAVADAKAKGFSKLDQWRFAMLLICESGYWQML